MRHSGKRHGALQVDRPEDVLAADVGLEDFARLVVWNIARALARDGENTS